MKNKKISEDINNEDKAFKNLESLIKDLHEETASKHSVYRRCLNKFGEFGLNQQQAEAYFLIMDALAPDYGNPPPRSRAAIDDLLAACILRALNLEDTPDISVEKRTEQAISELKKDLKTELTEWETWRFVQRIKVPPDGFQFGKVLFCNHSHESATLLTHRVEG